MIWKKNNGQIIKVKSDFAKISDDLNTFKIDGDKHHQDSANNLHDLKVMVDECNQKIKNQIGKENDAESQKLVWSAVVKEMNRKSNGKCPTGETFLAGNYSPVD